MASQPEAKFKSNVRKTLTESGRPHFAYCPNDAFRRGVPDILLCWNKVFVALELKINTVVSEVQKTFLQDVRKANGVAGTLRLLDNGMVEYTEMTKIGLGPSTRFSLPELPYFLDRLIEERERVRVRVRV